MNPAMVRYASILTGSDVIDQNKRPAMGPASATAGFLRRTLTAAFLSMAAAGGADAFSHSESTHTVAANGPYMEASDFTMLELTGLGFVLAGAVGRRRRVPPAL